MKYDTGCCPRESANVYSRSTATSPMSVTMNGNIMFQNIINWVSFMINLRESLEINSCSVTVFDHILII